MITKNLAFDVLSAALSKGVHYAEIFAEHNVLNSISVVNGHVEKSASGIDYGLGIRIFTPSNVIYSYTNDLSRDNLIKLARKCSSAIKSDSNLSYMNTVIFNFNNEELINKHKIKIFPNQVGKKQVCLIMKSASDSAFGYDKLITQTIINYMDSDQSILVANSDGVFKEDRRTRSRITVNAVASSDTEKQSGYFGPGAMMGYEFFDKTDVSAIAVEAARSAVTMLNAKHCESGKFPVIIDNGFGGVIFHEACGHGLEASHIVKNASVFSGKLNTKIANELVTAIDDGTIENGWGSINMDDEGENSKRTVLIENGILKSYMVDKHSGMKLNLAPTGSSRRQSYRHLPTSRMTNTFIANGTDTLESIISDTEYGIYAKYMGGGSVNTATGEFNFAVNEAYIVKNGKICEPVRGATLIGKGSEVLMNIDRVASNLKLSEGMCGASSGSIPVTVGQPSIRVKKLIVGGQN